MIKMTLLVLLLVVLSACESLQQLKPVTIEDRAVSDNTNLPTNIADNTIKATQSIKHNVKQFAFEQCVDEVWQQDLQAKNNASYPLYLSSAKLATHCLDIIGSDGSKQQKMRLLALSIQNFIKGGDINNAQTNLKIFNENYPNKDLYYTDGTSFSQTMELLLNFSNQNTIEILNVSPELKSEIRRMNYWQDK